VTCRCAHSPCLPIGLGTLDFQASSSAEPRRPGGASGGRRSLGLPSAAHLGYDGAPTSVCGCIFRNASFGTPETDLAKSGNSATQKPISPIPETGNVANALKFGNRECCKRIEIWKPEFANALKFGNREFANATKLGNRHCEKPVLQRNTKPVSPKHETGVAETQNRCRNTKPVSPKHETGLAETRNRSRQNTKPISPKHEIGLAETRNRSRRNTKPVSPKHESGLVETRIRCPQNTKSVLPKTRNRSHRNSKSVSPKTRNRSRRDTKSVSPKHETGVTETRNRCHRNTKPVSPKHESGVDTKTRNRSRRNTKSVSPKTRNRSRRDEIGLAEIGFAETQIHLMYLSGA
jgi:hypothetical protein